MDRPKRSGQTPRAFSWARNVVAPIKQERVAGAASFSSRQRRDEDGPLPYGWGPLTVLLAGPQQVIEAPGSGLHSGRQDRDANRVSQGSKSRW